MPEVIYLNGGFVSGSEAVIPIEDRGFLFGDAVYEVLRSYNGRLWALERHLRRLRRSLEEIDIHTVETEAIRQATEEAFRRSEFPNAHVYIHITRGVEPRKHAYGRDLSPTVLIHVRDFTPMVPPEVFAGAKAITLPDLRWRRCDIKSTNLLPNVLAQTRARDEGAHEAILVEEDGYITEAASMSVFCVEKAILITSPLSSQILPSITREIVIEIARDQGIPLREERVSAERLRKADEILLASTGHEVCPVIQLDGAPVGDGRMGPMTRRLVEGFRRRIEAGDDGPRQRSGQASRGG